MERVIGTGARLGLGRPDIWTRYALVGLKWMLFLTALWLVLVPLQVCLQCSVGGGGWASVLLIAAIATLLLGFLWVDQALIRRGRQSRSRTFPSNLARL